RREGIHPGVLQEPTEDGAHPDVLAQSGHPRLHRPDGPDDQVQLHPGARGTVEGVDGLLIHHRVDLHLHPGGPAGLGGSDLPLDAFDQAPAHRAWRHQEPVELAPRGVAGELVEQPGEVLAHVRVAGEQPVVLIHPRGLRVVVAGADVAVAAQTVRFLAHHQGELAVRLQPDDAVDHVHPGALQLARPGDVRLLVEAALISTIASTCLPASAASISESTIGESPEVRYRVTLIASTCGSVAAWARNCCTLVEKESYGWC